jgi:hypothetical protein
MKAFSGKIRPEACHLSVLDQFLATFLLLTCALAVSEQVGAANQAL